MKEMAYIPCPKRRFPYQISFLTFYASYLRWLRHYGFSVLDVPTLAGGLSG